MPAVSIQAAGDSATEDTFDDRPARAKKPIDLPPERCHVFSKRDFRYSSAPSNELESVPRKRRRDLFAPERKLIEVGWFLRELHLRVAARPRLAAAIGREPRRCQEQITLRT